MKNKSSLRIGRREARELIKLLSALQGHVEVAIESALPQPVPDEGPECIALILGAEVRDPYYTEVAKDRRIWKLAEAWMQRIEREVLSR